MHTCFTYVMIIEKELVFCPQLDLPLRHCMHAGQPCMYANLILAPAMLT